MNLVQFHLFTEIKDGMQNEPTALFSMKKLNICSHVIVQSSHNCELTLKNISNYFTYVEKIALVISKNLIILFCWQIILLTLSNIHPILTPPPPPLLWKAGFFAMAHSFPLLCPEMTL